MTRIVLASGSPRRHEMLERLGIDFEVIVPEIDERAIRGEDPSAYAAIRGELVQLAAAHRITAHVDSVWIAGFPLNGHPARDLRYVQQVPFGG